jgi:RHS repeat-associated protein
MMTIILQNTTYGYDDAGNQVSQTDAKTNQTTYTYNLMNRRTGRKLPNGLEETYNNNMYTGLMDSKIDFNGVRTDYAYDDATDMLTQESAGGKIINNTYDSSNRKVGVSINEGSVINMSFTYDVMDRMAGKTTPWDALAYTRVNGGKINTITTTKGYNEIYNYYSNNGLLQSRIDSGLTTTYGYDFVNNLQTITQPNGAVIAYTYNAVNKLTNILVTKSGTTIASWDYALGPTGNKTSVTESMGRAVTWAYDDLYRLTGEQIASTPVAGNIGYVYDDVGNRDQRSSDITPIPTQVFTYDQNDRVQAYSWDNNGNVLSDGRFNYTWNAKNELKRVQGTGVDVEYLYDADGLRLSRTDNLTGVTTYYVWDTENPTGYPQVVEEVEGGQVVRRYGYGLFLENVDIWNGSAFDRFYVIRDGTNSVRMLLDSAGNVAAEYDYDAFGNVLSTSNIIPLTANNPFGFHSEYKDPATGLIYLRARWYDVEKGRFLNQDGFEGDKESPLDLHKYIGFNDNPINITDALGLFGEESSIAGTLAYSPKILWPQTIPNSSTGIFSKGYPAAIVSFINYRHATVKIIPTDQKMWKESFPSIFNQIDPKTKKYFATIGGFPKNRLVSVYANFIDKSKRNAMVKTINEYFDVHMQSLDQEQIATEKNENTAIMELLRATMNYNNDVMYTLIPKGPGEYNSNSFHLGLLYAANIYSFPSFVTAENRYAGAQNILPTSYFK